MNKIKFRLTLLLCKGLRTKAETGTLNVWDNIRYFIVIYVL